MHPDCSSILPTHYRRRVSPLSVLKVKGRNGIAGTAKQVFIVICNYSCPVKNQTIGWRNAGRDRPRFSRAKNNCSFASSEDIVANVRAKGIISHDRNVRTRRSSGPVSPIDEGKHLLKRTRPREPTSVTAEACARVLPCHECREGCKREGGFSLSSGSN